MAGRDQFNEADRVWYLDLEGGWIEFWGGFGINWVKHAKGGRRQIIEWSKTRQKGGVWVHYTKRRSEVYKIVQASRSLKDVRNLASKLFAFSLLDEKYRDDVHWARLGRVQSQHI